MDGGFTSEHFVLLKAYGGNRYSVAEDGLVYKQLSEAYAATDAWARALKEALFPDGRVEVRKAPLNRGTSFWHYNWARIYPHKLSPSTLAFTVGIDASGEFIVKIDTVKAPEALREAYLSLRGENFADAPFAAVLPAKEGLTLSREQLVAWSAQEIKDFSIDYDSLAFRLGLDEHPLHLLTDASATKELMGSWIEALRAGAIEKGTLSWLPDTKTVMRVTTSSEKRLKVEVGDDPSGSLWAVQINEPRIAGDHNSLTAVAVNRKGHHFLMRQGMLRPQGEPHVTISSEQFIQRTGLRPTPVDASGLAAKRQWFVVTPLNADHTTIRQATGRFVDHCVAARSWREGQKPADPRPADLVYPLNETGGSYVINPTPAMDERTVLRRHGIAWLTLKEKLSKYGLILSKPNRHELGYEVDGVVSPLGQKPVLIEIKTSITSADIQTGVGQLHLYRQLFPGYSDHTPVLLVPEWPSQKLIEAVTASGISIHRYSFGENPETDISFEASFLITCGVRQELLGQPVAMVGE